MGVLLSDNTAKLAGPVIAALLALEAERPDGPKLLRSACSGCGKQDFVLLVRPGDGGFYSAYTGVWIQPLLKKSDRGRELLAVAAFDVPLAFWEDRRMSRSHAADAAVAPSVAAAVHARNALDRLVEAGLSECCNSGDAHIIEEGDIIPHPRARP